MSIDLANIAVYGFWIMLAVAFGAGVLVGWIIWG